MGRNKFDMELSFTETYKRYKDKPKALREAMCLKSQYPAILNDIKEGDLFAGRASLGSVGFSIRNQPGGFIYYCNFDEIEQILEKKEHPPKKKKKIRDMLDFWKTENTHYKLRSSYPAELANAIPGDDWQNEPGVAFPLYRMAGGYLDFEKLVTLGIPGLKELINDYKEKFKRKNSDLSLFKGMEIALDLLVEVCFYYAEQARKKARKAEKARAYELNKMAEILEKITRQKPETFREAIQLVWLYVIVSQVRNYGRMDVYLGDFLVNDLNTGRITIDKALNLLCSLWQIMADRKTIFDGRVVIGGKGRPNEVNADRFALLAIEATRMVKEMEPQLSLRCYQGMNKLLLDKALISLEEGRTFPILYNDDVNIPAVQKAFEVSYKEALDYVPFGCGEYVINHKSFGTPSGVINLLKALEITLNNGRCFLSGKKLGLETGKLNNFETFEELFKAYKKQVEYFVEIMARQEELEYKIAGQEAAFLYHSLLYDNCLERGKAIFSGGIKYLGGTLESYGNTNTADSLTAIKEIVYDKKIYSLEELVNALKHNFRNYSGLRKKLLDSPKYGNDLSQADEMAKRVHNHLCRFTRKQKQNTELDSYLIVIINNSANTYLGKYTGASADGRLAREAMNNGNAPYFGRDKEGITALLNSLVKLDPSIHAGAVQNLKFSKELFNNNRPIIENLLKVYFKKGGTQAMITVVGQKDLQQALIEPEKYENLFVRVGGFTARFVNLEPEIQQEILKRTLY